MCSIVVVRSELCSTIVVELHSAIVVELHSTIVVVRSELCSTIVELHSTIVVELHSTVVEDLRSRRLLCVELAPLDDGALAVCGLGKLLRLLDELLLLRLLEPASLLLPHRLAVEVLLPASLDVCKALV